LSDVDRQKAKDSFTYLRGILGEGFLRRADQEPNPIFLWYFRNAAPPSRLALIRLVGALKALEGTKNFRSALRDIKRRLRSQEDFERLGEKLSMVRIAHKFLIGGFDIEFDPIVNVVDVAGRSAPKKPDLKIVDDEKFRA
jgi:hypothetical protein